MKELTKIQAEPENAFFKKIFVLKKHIYSHLKKKNQTKLILKRLVELSKGFKKKPKRLGRVKKITLPRCPQNLILLFPLKKKGDEKTIFHIQKPSAFQLTWWAPLTHNALSGWLKRNGGLKCGVSAGSLELCKALNRTATAVFQTSPTFFIYLLWNIYGCYERFKIMCLSLSCLFFPFSFAPAHSFLMHK